MQVPRIEEIVFNGIARAGDVGVLETANRAYKSDLHIKGQAGGNPVGIQLAGRQPLWLNKDLVRAFVRKAMDLVFDTRTIARPHALNDTGEERGAIQPIANNIVSFFIGMRHPAATLLRMVINTAQERHDRLGAVAPLLFQVGEIYSAGIDTRRCTGLQAIHPEGQLAQPLCQRNRWWVSGATTSAVVQADMQLATQKRTCGQNHPGRPERKAHLGDGTRHPPIFN